MSGSLRRAAALLLLAIAGAGCGSSSPAAPPPPTTYRLRLTAAGGEPHSALVSLGGISGEVRVVAAGGVLSRVSAGTSPLVLLVGPLADQELLEVQTVTPGTAPQAAVVSASAGAASGYRRLAGAEVTVEWVAVE